MSDAKQRHTDAALFASTDLDVLVLLGLRRAIFGTLPGGLKHDRHRRKSGEDGLEQVGFHGATSWGEGEEWGRGGGPSSNKSVIIGRGGGDGNKKSP